MRLLVVGLVLTVMTPGCDASMECDDDSVCDAVESTYRINRFEIHGRQSETLEVAGKIHHVVHFSYGLGVNCDTTCLYSHLCTLVVDGKDHPSSFAFNTKTEWLFEPASYCPGMTKPSSSTDPKRCSMPAYKLDAMGDAAFELWVRESGDAKYEMRWCRQSLDKAYEDKVIP